MELKSILLDRSSTLRSGWRFAAFLVAFLFLATAFGGTAVALLSAVGIQATSGSTIFIIVNSVLSLILAILVGWLCGRYLEGLPFRALGTWFTKFWLKHFIIGSLVGTATVGLAVLIAVAFGGLRFEPNSADMSGAIFRSTLSSFAIFAIAAAFEEALFRGYVLQSFNRSGLGWLAVILTSSFFGIAHMTNPNVGIISTINTMLAGVWFSIAYLKTRDLWFVWGLHLFWNWVQGEVFGIEVSGITAISAAPLLKEIDKGPTWLTGETYGIEGGLACTAAIIASTIVIHFLPILRPSSEMATLTSPGTRIEST